jgi:drug/metabolite transporter (DMT)-like permease
MSGRIYLLLLAGVFSVSWAAPLIRMCDAPALVIAIYRMGIASLILLPIVLWRYPQETKHLLSSGWKLSLLSGVFLGLHFAFWVSSLFYTSVASSVVIVATQPLFALTLSWFFLKEKAHLVTFLAIVLALAGVYVVAAGDFQLDKKHLIGDVLALLGAVMAAAYYTVGRNLRRTFHIAPYVLVVYSISAITLAVIVSIYGLSFSPVSDKNIWLLVLLAIVPTVIGHSLFNYLLKYITAFMVGISILGEPIGASLWAFLLFAEVPAKSVYLGGALILVSVVMALWNESRTLLTPIEK